MLPCVSQESFCAFPTTLQAFPVWMRSPPKEVPPWHLFLWTLSFWQAAYWRLRLCLLLLSEVGHVGDKIPFPQFWVLTLDIHFFVFRRGAILMSLPFCWPPSSCSSLSYTQTFCLEIHIRFSSSLLHFISSWQNPPEFSNHPKGLKPFSADFPTLFHIFSDSRLLPLNLPFLRFPWSSCPD